jgi:superfamily II DNA/RNA helicase
VPRVCDDYLHRVGRTARAGRGGLALTFVSQFDIAIFKEIETFVGRSLDEYKGAKEAKVLELVKKVMVAKKMAKMHLDDYALTTQQVY